jgi:inosine-uridine nucleoside N-ribohydrolase
MPRPLLLDVDTGVDDAIAIALASRLDDHRLIAMTTVAGNVPVEFATTNTLRVARWLTLDVPVYRGMSAPLVRPLIDARAHHGYDGLGGWHVPVEPGTTGESTAPQVIVDLARQHQGDITFVFTGPLTNLAVALSLEPRLTQWVSDLVIMGGAFFNPGNVTSEAEFNIYVDPEAAAQVAASGIRATWIGLDVTHQTTINRRQWDAMADVSDPAGTLVREVTRQTLVDLGKPRFPLHDPLAMAVAERSEIVGCETGVVLVDTSETHRGRTRLAKAANSDTTARVASTVDQQAFSGLFGRLVPALG